VDRAFRKAYDDPTFAVAYVADADAPKLAVGTLDQVQWKKDDAILAGPYLTEKP
jgi:hypothetical protein